MYIRIKSITPLTGMIRNCSCKAQRDLSLPPDKSLCRWLSIWWRCFRFCLIFWCNAEDYLQRNISWDSKRSSLVDFAF